MPHNEYTIERDSNFISGFGRAVRIISIHDEGPTTVQAEWYILIDGLHPRSSMGSIEVDMHDAGTNHRRLTNMMKNEADILISGLLDEQINSSGSHAYVSYRHEWETIGEPELIELWLPGRHKAAFAQIIEETRCLPLKSILLDVVKRPVLGL